MLKKIICLLVLASIVGCNSKGKYHRVYQGRIIDPYEKKGYVPDTTTAIRIAEAVWSPIYGDDITEEKPFMAKLVNDTTWLVTGTLHSEVGGVAGIKIDKRSGAVRAVFHGK